MLDIQKDESAEEQLERDGLDYKGDLEIDADALDLEWIHQPSIFMKYASLLSRQERRVRHLEQRVKITQSRLILEVTQNPSILGSGMSKATMQNIEAYYRTHTDYQAAKEELHDAEYKRDLLAHAVNAFNQRKVALENLVRLMGQQYFAGPKAPRDLGKEVFQYRQARAAATNQIMEARQKARTPGAGGGAGSGD